MQKYLRLAVKTLLSGTAKDTYLIFSSNLFSSFLAFLYTIFLVRVFSPESLGIFSSVTAFILLTSDVLDLGITTSLSRFYPEIKRKEGQIYAQFFINNTFIFKITITLIVSLFVVMIAPFLSQVLLKSNQYSILFLLTSIGIFALCLTSFSAAALSARKEFFPVALINISSTLIKLFLVVLLYYFNRFTLAFVTASFAVAPFFSFLLSLKFIRLKIIGMKFSYKLLKKLMSYSVFIAIARIFSAVSSRFDALMLIPLSSAYEAGIYSAAYKIIFTYILLSGSFSMVIAPRLSSFSTIKESLPYLKKIILAVIIILSTMGIMYFIAPVFVPFILGAKYIPAIPVFRSLLLPMALFVSTIPSVNFLLYVAKKPQISAINTFVQIPIILFSNFYFIPIYGRFGPVISLSFAYGFTLISSISFTIYYLKRG